MTDRFEYRIIECTRVGDGEHSSRDELQQAGNDGWDLISVSWDGHIECFYFKRKREE